MKFKSDIEVQAGLKDNSDSSGASGQVLSSTANGVSWISPDTFSSESSEKTHIPVKNTSGATIAKGTPVYITGETGNSGKIEIAPADASDSAKMPAVGILEVALTNNSEGFCISGGLLEGLATDTIDGTTTTANDTVYVKSGGGLTMTKPTGSDNLIQNVAKIARVHASNGSLVVSSILRTNDVPNLPEGRIWVGDGNTTVSDTVFLDEPNGKMGIGTTSPNGKLSFENSVETRKIVLYEGGDNDFQFYGFGIEANKLIYTTAFNDDDHVFYSGASATTRNELMRIEGGGNVGIGTTSPTSKIHVIGQDATFYSNTGSQSLQIGRNVNERLEMYVNDNMGKITAIQDSDNNGPHNFILDRIFAGTGSNDFRIQKDGSTQLLVDTNGNVGIGTTSPSEKLEVQGGNIKIDTTTNTDAKLILNPYSSALGTAYQWELVGASSSQNYNFQIREAGQAYVTVDSSVSGNAGYVGIGTTSPTAPLDVSGVRLGRDWAIANRAVIRLDSNGVSEPSDILFGHTAAANETSWTGAYWSLSSRGSSDGNKFHFYRASGNPTISSEAVIMTFDPNLNVGIGTTSPDKQLTFGAENDDAIQIRRLTTSQGAPSVGTGISWTWTSGSTDTQTWAAIRTIMPGSGNTHMTFSTKAPGGSVTERMRIADSGNVGIGTTSPSEKLDVAGNIKLSGVLYVGSRGIYQAQNTDVSGLELVANASINLYRAAFFDYVIQKQGNVRAGTVFACNDGVSVEYTETSTNDIGDTSDVVLSVDISGTNMRLLADAATSGWSVKSLIRAI